MKKKVFAISFFIGVFALILSVGSLAFFTDKTEEVKNTFTVGKVDIDLTEETGDLDWTGDGVKLVPSENVYTKEAKVTVVEGSEDAYVVARIDLNNASQFVRAVANKTVGPENGAALAENVINNLGTGGSVKASEATGSAKAIINMFNQLLGDYVAGFNKNNDWTLYGVTANVADDIASFYIVANGVHEAGDELPVFDGIKLPAEADQDMFVGTDFSGSKISLTAYAIQAEGLADQDTAVDALFEEFEINDFKN